MTTPAPKSAEQTYIDCSDAPQMTHKACSDTNCRTCLEDSWKWKRWAEAKRPELAKHDALGLYHGWLQSNEIRAELHGWMSPEAWDKSNMQAFMADPFCGPRRKSREWERSCIEACAGMADPAAEIESLRTAVADREKHLRVLAEEVEALRAVAKWIAFKGPTKVWDAAHNMGKSTDAARSLDFVKGLKP